MAENAKEEKIEQPSSERKEEKVGKSSDFGAVSRQIKAFKEEQEKSKATEKVEKEQKKPAESAVKEEKLETEKKELPGEEKQPEPKLFLVDEKGNKTPLIFKADGKFEAPEAADKVLTYLGLGVHANKRLEEIKVKEEYFKQTEPFLKALQKAEADGRLYVEDEKGTKIKVSELKEEAEKVTEEEEEEIEITDPELQKANKRITDLEKKLKEREAKEFDGFLEGQKKKIQDEIEGHKKTHFAAFDRDDQEFPQEVWQLLAKNPEMSVEEATKKSHESVLNFVKKVIEKSPNSFIDKDRIYADKLEEKTKKETAPISSPSEILAGLPPAKEEKKKGYMDYVRAGFKSIGESHKAGKES
jgi:hypothetical protein